MHVGTHQELAKSVSLEGLVQVRNDIKTRVEEAQRLLMEAEEIIEANGLPDSMSSIVGPGSRHNNGANLCRGEAERAMKKIDAGLWNRLMEGSGLMSFMSASRRTKWRHQVGDLEIPEFTADSIAMTFQEIHGSRQDMMEEGVVEVFRKLSWDFKTNNPRAFGKKIILKHFCDTSHGFMHFNHETCSEVDDLERIFHIFNGRPEPDYRYGTYHRCKELRDEGHWEAETPYLKLRWFKKGTVHIEFKDRETVAVMNRIVGRAFPDALPRAEKRSERS